MTVGLVTKQRRGREQLVRTDPDAVGVARQALDQLELAWRGRVERIREQMEQVLGMGAEEGLTQAVGQMDAVLND